MDIGKLKAASERVEDGEWIGDIPNLGDAELLVRSLASPSVKRPLARAMRLVPKAGRTKDGSILPHVQDRIDREIVAEHVLLGWRGLTEDGEPVEYSRALAYEWLAIPLFAEAVQAAINRATGKAMTALEELRGNSQAPSKPS